MIFATPLIIEDTGKTRNGREVFRVVEDFSYNTDSGETITVPVDFETDFASVPRFFWRVFPPHGLYGKAAVLHDFLRNDENCSKKYADGVFYEAMVSLKVPYWKRSLIYAAVRIF